MIIYDLKDIYLLGHKVFIAYICSAFYSLSRHCECCWMFLEEICYFKYVRIKYTGVLTASTSVITAVDIFQ